MDTQIVSFPAVLFGQMAAALDGALAATIDAEVRERIALARRLLATSHPTGAQTAAGGLAPWQIGKIEAHVQRNIGEAISNADLATLTRLSTSYFCKAFRVSFGDTPQHFILNKRVEHACALMMDTPDTLADIAYACGFTDQAHLSRQFRRVIGTSPNAWRRHFSTDRGGKVAA